MSGTAGSELTSIRSPRIKAARQLSKRALRLRARSFLAEGPQAVTEALAREGTVSQLFITAGARARHAGLAEQAAGQGADIAVVSGEIMAELAQTITPQGVLAVCRFVDAPLTELLRKPPRLAVILAHVRDPGNAGTVLRTADAAGAHGVVFSGASVDPYNSKCVRASAGSIFHLPIVTGADVSGTIASLREAGLRVLAADGRTGESLDTVRARGALARPTAWLFGNEAWGVPAALLADADEVVAVPIYGRAESLNLAAAAAVCLYASAQEQRGGPSERASASGPSELRPANRPGE